MRTNQPVSQNEYPLAPEAILLSTTDTESHIRYASAAFREASGFDLDEMQDQPHNLVRHPDMPVEAFADMWATLKGGQSWSALVKNRRKNGDHYWVRANATPVHRNSQVTGYLSVRTTPSRQEVERTEEVYREFREGRASGLRFHKGLVVRKGLLAWLSLPQLLSVRGRIRTLVALAGLATVGTSAVAGIDASFSLTQALDSLLVLPILCWLLERQLALPLDQVLTQSQAVATGQPGKTVELNRVDEIGLILRNVNQAGLNLRSLIADVSGQTVGLASASSEIAAGNLDLSARTEQTAASLQEAAASMEQLTSTVKSSADAAREASAVASGASAIAARGENAVRAVVLTMSDITQASERITEVIGLIDGIAFQTNILALNASIEAAHAGAQGRGFAVVATEVRSLAQKSAEAASEIKTLIGDSSRRVQAGVVQAAEAGETIQGLRIQVAQVSALMANISTATQEQAAGIGQVNIAVAQMDSATQENAALVEQSAAAAQTMQLQTALLAQAISAFSL